MPLGFQTGLPLDPTPFTAWGVMGILAFVIVVMGMVLYRLFVRQTSSMEIRDKVLMDFVDRHRGETSAVLEKVASTVADSYHEMKSSMQRQTRVLDELIMSQRVLDQIEKLKRAGSPLTQQEVDLIIRSIMHERRERSE